MPPLFGRAPELGVHNSKVRSCSLDTWLPEQVAFVSSMGNARANAFWEATLPAGFRRPPENDMSLLRTYITDKYVARRYADKEFSEPPTIDNFTTHQFMLRLAASQAAATEPGPASAVAHAGTAQQAHQTLSLPSNGQPVRAAPVQSAGDEQAASSVQSLPAKQEQPVAQHFDLLSLDEPEGAPATAAAATSQHTEAPLGVVHTAGKSVGRDPFAQPDALVATLPAGADEARPASAAQWDAFAGGSGSVSGSFVSAVDSLTSAQRQSVPAASTGAAFDPFGVVQQQQQQQQHAATSGVLHARQASGGSIGMVGTPAMGPSTAGAALAAPQAAASAAAAASLPAPARLASEFTLTVVPGAPPPPASMAAAGSVSSTISGSGAGAKLSHDNIMALFDAPSHSRGSSFGSLAAAPLPSPKAYGSASAGLAVTPPLQQQQQQAAPAASPVQRAELYPTPSQPAAAQSFGQQPVGAFALGNGISGGGGGSRAQAAAPQPVASAALGQDPFSSFIGVSSVGRLQVPMNASSQATASMQHNSQPMFPAGHGQLVPQPQQQGFASFPSLSLG